MKNIHILPTDKPSRLWTNNLRRRLELDEFPEQHPTNIAKHIYITSDEEIKVGDWFYLDDAEIVAKHINVKPVKEAKKIILTNNPDLIADGVQAIDNEFLEWFVKNPTCEEVEVEEVYFHGSGYYKASDLSEKEKERHKFMRERKIIIPQGEPKQELELKDFESGDILDVLNMGNVEYLGNGDIIYNPNLFFIKRGDKWFIKTEEPKQETNLDKKSLYIQDYKSRISALQYVIDFYEILTKEDIVKQKDDYSKQLKDLENE
jgi:hypothetical protein